MCTRTVILFCTLIVSVLSSPFEIKLNNTSETTSNNPIGTSKIYNPAWNGPAPTEIRANDNGNCCCENSLRDPSGFVRLSGNSVYYVQTFFKANVFTAVEYCRTIGMHLLSLETEAESQALENYINTFGLDTQENIWTSGTDLGKNSEWKWLSTGQRLTYINWLRDPPQPDNPDEEHCIALVRSGGRTGLPWNNLACTALRYFACEREEPPKCSLCNNQC